MKGTKWKKNLLSLAQVLLGGLLVVWMLSWEDQFERPNFFDSPSSSPENEPTAILRKEMSQQDLFEERVFSGGEEEIITLVNQARGEAGMGNLSRNEKLSRSALAKALDMKNKNYFQHVSPEGIQPWFFAEKESYQYKSFGENLAEGFFSAEEVHLAWMNSPGHRENILSESFSEVGVGIVDFEQNGMKSYLIVQHFGQQLSAEELVPQVVCKEKSRLDCLDGEKKLKEVRRAIEDQEEIIDDAEDAGASDEDLEDAEENLDKLKDIKDELKEYLARCEEFIAGCDHWE